MPELPVVLLEDFGAITGLVIAFVAVVASIVTGNGIYDGIGSVAIGLILGTMAIVLCVEMKSLLIGEPVSAHDRAIYRQAMEGTPGVVRVIHDRTEYLGPEDVLHGQGRVLLGPVGGRAGGQQSTRSSTTCARRSR